MVRGGFLRYLSGFVLLFSSAASLSGQQATGIITGTITDPQGGVVPSAEIEVRNVARLLPDGARVAVAEFHPDGPCEVGAPRERRLPPAVVRAWCDAAGLGRPTYRRQSPEPYLFTMHVQRVGPSA